MTTAAEFQCSQFLHCLQQSSKQNVQEPLPPSDPPLRRCFECLKCDYTTTSKLNLKRHIWCAHVMPYASSCYILHKQHQPPLSATQNCLLPPLPMLYREQPLSLPMQKLLPPLPTQYQHQPPLPPMQQLLPPLPTQYQHQQPLTMQYQPLLPKPIQHQLLPQNGIIFCFDWP